MLTIHDRPFPPIDRSEPGHWEGDLIIGDNHLSAIGTLVERQTRMLRLVHLPRADSDSLHAALVARMQDLPPALMRSITWDQGAEMARHLATSDKLGAPVYFCDSRSPWQRGSNENPNGLLRDYPQGRHPRQPFPGAPQGSRGGAEQPTPDRPPRPLSRRSIHGPPSLTESVDVATLTRTHPGAGCSAFTRSRHGIFQKSHGLASSICLIAGALVTRAAVWLESIDQPITRRQKVDLQHGYRSTGPLRGVHHRWSGVPQARGFLADMRCWSGYSSSAARRTCV